MKFSFFRELFEEDSILLIFRNLIRSIQIRWILFILPISPLHLNNLQKIGRILLADVLLFEAPVFGGGALDGDLDRVVAVAAVDGVDGGGQAGLLGAVDRVEQVGLDGRGGGVQKMGYC